MDATITKPSPVPAVLGIIGGALLAVGALLTWATVSVDTEAIVNRLADVLGISADQLAGQLPTQALEESVTGTSAGVDGWICVVAGAAVVAAAIVGLTRPATRRAMGIVMVVAALVGGALVAWNMTRVSGIATDAEEAATTTAGANLEQLGVGGEIFDGVFDVSMGVGLIACGIGAVVASIGGRMAVVARTLGSSAIDTGAVPRMDPVTGSGFEAVAAPPPPVISGTPVPPTPVHEAGPTPHLGDGDDGGDGS